jgi:hypothetical protein
VITQQPGYVLTIYSPTASCDVGAISISGPTATNFDQTQTWTGSSTCGQCHLPPGYAPPCQTNVAATYTGVAGSRGGAFSTYLLSPSEVAGSATHVAAVQFCYGAGAATAGSGKSAQSASMTINDVKLYGLDEPATPTNDGNGPPYAHNLLIDAPLHLTGGSNCQTVTPSAPVAIDSSEYLMFQVFALFSATAGDFSSGSQANTASVPLTLGRITVTYSP